MILFELRPQFDRNSGDPVAPKPSYAGLICDYCGHVFEDGLEIPDPSYKVEESGNTEAGWHEDKLILGEDEIDLYELFSTHPEFTYCQDWCNPHHTCSRDMIDSWIEHRGINGPTDLGHLQELCHVMYKCRYLVVEKLFKEGYTLDRLGLVTGE